ncbi:hypothetical protein PR202_ga24707 [Eleusine coracana subsp. coracana]|uniref:Protein kinase domain-containing protein n=1 Tax=Eleusine coracana subsp. coracana TaxID=191504 RepID=A0AAV5D9M2_ELECO|nr:hypothetical protein PR202_ga24707 [Eleusine coracana subsp. coracana]
MTMARRDGCTSHGFIAVTNVELQANRVSVPEVQEAGAFMSGYMAPEYLMKGIFSPKADIFSFGNIIIEIITGSKDYPMIEYQLDRLPSTDKIITGEMDDRMRDDMSQQLFIDNVLGRWTNTFQSESKYSSPEMRTQQVKQCMTVALKCLDPDMKKRPNARDIMEMLGAVETSKMDPGDLRNSPVDQEAVQPSEFLALEGVSAAVFIERMEWFVTGDYEGYIKVYCYSTMRQLKVLKAHESVVTSLDIHPTEPYVLSAAQDNHVKLWDWKKDWACVRAFEARL